MKPNALARHSRALGAAAGVAAVAVPAVAPAEAQTPTPAEAEKPAAKPKLHAVAQHHIRQGSRAPVKGRLSSGAAHRRVVVQVNRRGRGWKNAARTRTRSHGRFRVKWRARHVGRYRMRVVAPHTRAHSRRVRGRLTVYRSVRASYYGPGLYGNKLACGGTLKPGTVGVANKTLPCGTKVSLRYHGHTTRVPVVDRGPYAAGRTYDLTEATKRRLHFGSTGTVLSSR